MLYIDCEPFEESNSHFTLECEPQCADCHKMDVATRLMIGRPNKGPHFSVIHMAIGDVALYEVYHEQSEVKELCGSPSTGEIDRTFYVLFKFSRMLKVCLLYTSPSPRDATLSRMPSSA